MVGTTEVSALIIIASVANLATQFPGEWPGLHALLHHRS